jgi:hypothetical protein
VLGATSFRTSSTLRRYVNRKILVVIKISNIAKGWFASKIFKSKSIQELSVERLKHCEPCRNTKQSKFLKFINGDAREIETLVCNGCGCPVVEKSLVKNETCPQKKWKQ